MGDTFAKLDRFLSEQLHASLQFVSKRLSLTDEYSRLRHKIIDE